MYTNSTQLPVTFTDDIFECCDLQDELQSLYTGGTVQHLYIGERIEDIETCKNLIRSVFHFPVLKQLDWLAGGVFGFIIGCVLCFVFFTAMPLLQSVIPLEQFQELVKQSALAKIFENGNLIISIMNRQL